MAERNSAVEAVVLSVRRQGEQDYSVSVFAKDAGILRATLYGGPKSRKRSLVQPFNRGTMYLYADESRGLRKIHDFDVTAFHPSFRASLYKMWAANLAGELVLKTQCGGDYGRSFVLLNGFLDGMEASGEEESRLGMLRFLWRYLAVLGVQPDPSSCVHCGQPLLGGASYSATDGGFVCPDCMTPGGQAERMLLDGEALRYLDAVNTQSPRSVRQTPLHADSAYAIKHLTFHLAEQAALCRLNTLESGTGIL